MDEAVLLRERRAHRQLDVHLAGGHVAQARPECGHEHLLRKAVAHALAVRGVLRLPRHRILCSLGPSRSAGARVRRTPPA